MKNDFWNQTECQNTSGERKREIKRKQGEFITELLREGESIDEVRVM